MRLKVTYLGHSYDAAPLFPEGLTLPDDADLEQALALLARQLPADRALPGTCLVVLSGKHHGTVARHDNPPLTATDELVLLAPVAGG